MTLTGSRENVETVVQEKDLKHLNTVVYRYCLSLARSGWDAEDLVQDTWLKAFEAHHELSHSNPEAWLLRIAKNTWIDHKRRSTVLSRILKRERPAAILPDNGLFGAETVLHALTNHLSPIQRTVFLLRDVFGYSNKEAADMLKTTEGAVKSALHRARYALDAVRKDLERGGLPSPMEESEKSFLRAFAVAYQKGDISALLVLAQADEMAPALRCELHQRKLRRRIRFAQNRHRESDARMAA